MEGWMDGWMDNLFSAWTPQFCLSICFEDKSLSICWAKYCFWINSKLPAAKFLLTMQFPELWFISVSHGKVYFHLAKKPQWFFFQVQFLLQKVYFSSFQKELVKTAYGACSTRPLPPISSGVKKWLSFCIARRIFYSAAYSFISSWFLNAFQGVAFSLRSTKCFRPLLLFPFHAALISWNHLKLLMQSGNISLQIPALSAHIH